MVPSRPPQQPVILSAPTRLGVDLSAAIIGVGGGMPYILAVPGPEQAMIALPAGSYDPAAHRTFELALRAFVGAQTGLPLGYVEQLYTFGDRGRTSGEAGDFHNISVGYLGLTRIAPDKVQAFLPWYGFFPWEDWREGRPALLDRTILPLLRNWADDKPDDAEDSSKRALNRHERIIFCFGTGITWDEEKVLERYELLYETGLVQEARRDGLELSSRPGHLPELGRAMHSDHRRILATAIGRLRGKLKYRPVIFELMPDHFTLTTLQTAVEAISGRHLHKQNFRRLVESNALVEPTGQSTRTSGRPAMLYQFRREVVAERPATGLRVMSRI
jgi:hypothetical protein